MRPAPLEDAGFIRTALGLARRGRGATSPNPMVGAVLVNRGRIIGRGWHRRAGEPHAEIEAIRDALRRGETPAGATLYVTLEPCCTHGRTPPCTQAIFEAKIRRVVIGATDPNPSHRGRGAGILRRAGLQVSTCDDKKAPMETHRIASECARLNEAFNHWIVHRTPFVTVKAAMTLDGKIAAASGESKWITSDIARGYAMRLRQGADGILAGVNTILIDNPSLTLRRIRGSTTSLHDPKPLRRVVLDSLARTPIAARVVTDEFAPLTTIVVTRRAPAKRVEALRRRVQVLVAPVERRSNPESQIPLPWLLQLLGQQDVTSLLVEGGGEVNASFLLSGLAHRIAFFYAPKILGGRDSRPAVGGLGAATLAESLNLEEIQWRRLGPDLLLTAKVQSSAFDL
jgi:diaminohydroxyphosphoribosylaminopyrimidine deaminase/5-amino-6-(5-phosphoribosylamino)uracil reductase